MSNLWRNEDGRLLVGDSGNPILCDDCPCGGGEMCRDLYSSTYLVNINNGAGTIWEGTVANMTASCIAGGDFPLPCVWTGEVPRISGSTDPPFWWVEMDSREEFLPFVTDRTRVRRYTPAQAYPTCSAGYLESEDFTDDDPAGTYTAGSTTIVVS